MRECQNIFGWTRPPSSTATAPSIPPAPFPMFSSLSRGSSTVRQSYICSSCLCNLVAPSITQHPRLPVDRTSRAASTPFSTTARNFQIDHEDSSNAPDAGTVPISSGVKNAERSTRNARKVHGRGKGHDNTSSTPISKSRTTLKALRESLIAEAAPPAPKTALKKQELSSRSGPKNPKSSASGLTTIDASPEARHDKEKTKRLAVPSPKKSKKKGGNKSNPASNTKATKDSDKKVPNGKSASDEGAKLPKKTTKSGKTKQTLPKSAQAEINKLKSGSSTKYRVWRVTSEDGREYTIRRHPSTLDNPDLESYEQFLTDNPSIRTKLDDSGTITSVRTGLLRLLENGQLSEHEKALLTPEILRIRRALSVSSWDMPSDANDSASSIGGKPSKQKSHSANKTRMITNKGVGVKMGLDQKESGDSTSRTARGELRTPPGPVEAIRGGIAEEIKTISANNLHLVPLDHQAVQVPRLSYGLERVLFNPGVYHLQDPRSRVFNFDPYLQTIMPVSEFDFDALKQYITSSRDQTLLSKALSEKKKYTGSTSSMTSALAHFHFLLSQWRQINTANLSKMFPVEYKTFTALQRGPVSIFLRWRNGTYAIDADKQFDTGNILSMLGKSMEKLLTLPTKDFEKYRKANSDQLSEEERNADESFHYTGMGDFLMRSQLDAHDPRLPGTGMFDLKTRSVISVRMDTSAYEEGRGYEIRGRHGEWESFEREYYDMIRSAFLKYSLQVRMGRMDGIFVAYHNTERIFGFQYISLPELDYALHGTEDTTTGDSEFKLSLELLNRVLDRATAKYPQQSLRLHFETRDTVTPFTYIFAEPITETDIDSIQATNKAKIEEFEAKVLGLTAKDLSPEEQKEQWDSIRASVEESMEQDESDPEGVLMNEDVSDEDLEEDEKELVEILSTSGLEQNSEEEDDGSIEDEHEEDDEHDVEDDTGDSEVDKSHRPVEAANTDEPMSASGLTEQDLQEEADESSLSDPENVDEGDSSEEEPIVIDEDDQTPNEQFQVRRDPKDLTAMTLTIRNKVNGRYVERPEDLRPDDKWEVEYALSELHKPEQISSLYAATKMRRRRALTKTVDSKADAWNNIFIENIKKFNKKGRAFRERQNEIEKGLPKKVLDVGDGKDVWSPHGDVEASLKETEIHAAAANIERKD